MDCKQVIITLFAFSMMQGVFPQDDVDLYLNVTKDNIAAGDKNLPVMDPTGLSNALQELIQSDPLKYGSLDGQFTLVGTQETDLLSSVNVNACPAGTYSLDGDLVCTPCPAGTYSTAIHATTASTCTSCMIGTYLETTGASSADACIPCPVNTWNDVTGVNSISGCKSCPAYSVSLAGNHDLNQCKCVVGYSANPTAGEDCLACLPGYYKTLDDNSQCIACPAGTSLSGTASSTAGDCIVCTGGTYSPVDGSSTCSVCGVGTYSNDGSIGCTECNRGTYSDIQAAVCIECPAGTYQGDVVGALDTCMNCSIGTYSTTTGADIIDVCLACPAGQTSDSGSISCRECPANEYSESGGVCLACPANSSSPGNTGISGCVCYVGFERLDGDTCQVCGVGTYGADGYTCVNCPSGTTQTELMMTDITACKNCPAGSSSNAGSTECFICPNSTYSPAEGTGMCIDCDKGSFSVANATVCDVCPTGSFAEGPISDISGCLTCPSGYICTTPGVKEMCPLGTYSNDTGRSDGDCLDCEANYFCPMPFLKNHCPPETVSLPKTTSMLGCTCVAGVVCTYKKVVEIAVSLNISAAQFNTKDIQQLFVSAVAQAAHVDVGNVYLAKIINHNTGEEQYVTLYNRRRLLRSLHEDKPGIHVTVSVVGAHKVNNLDQHLAIRGLDFCTDYAWYARHDVETRTL